MSLWDDVKCNFIWMNVGWNELKFALKATPKPGVREDQTIW